MKTTTESQGAILKISEIKSQNRKNYSLVFFCVNNDCRNEVDRVNGLKGPLSAYLRFLLKSFIKFSESLFWTFLSLYGSVQSSAEKICGHPEAHIRPGAP